MIAALVLVLFGGAVQDCPARLDLKIRKVAPAAQRYADCMSFMRLPTEAERVERKKQCETKRPKGKDAEPIVGWVDHVSTTLAGCETRLRIVRR